MRLFLREKKQKRGMLLQTDSKHMSLLSCGPAVLAVYNVMIFLLLHCYCPQADRNYKCVKQKKWSKYCVEKTDQLLAEKSLALQQNHGP